MFRNLTHMLLCVDIRHKQQMDFLGRITSIFLAVVFLIEIYSY